MSGIKYYNNSKKLSVLATYSLITGLKRSVIFPYDHSFFTLPQDVENLRYEKTLIGT